MRPDTQTLPVYFINLDRSLDRLAFMQGQFKAAGIAAERIQAADGEAEPDLQERRSNLTPGERGCYESHRRVWRAFLSSGGPHALVLEDDAQIPANLSAVTHDLLAALPKGWDFVHLYSSGARAHRPICRVNERHNLVRYSRIPGGSVAYLLSRSGAEKLSRYTDDPAWPVDTDLRRPWRFGLNSYGVSPPLISHSAHLPGTLTQRSRRRRGLTLGPLRSLSGAVWNIRKLGFAWWLRCLLCNAVQRLQQTPPERR